MQHNNTAHPIMDSDKNASVRLIAAVILQAVSDLDKDDASAHKKDALEFFWGRNTTICDAYLTLLNYEPKQFKDKLKAQYEAKQLPVVA